MARRALKQLVEQPLEEEIAEYWGCLATNMRPICTTTGTVTMSDTF